MVPSGTPKTVLSSAISLATHITHGRVGLYRMEHTYLSYSCKTQARWVRDRSEYWRSRSSQVCTSNYEGGEEKVGVAGAVGQQLQNKAAC